MSLHGLRAVAPLKRTSLNEIDTHILRLHGLRAVAPLKHDVGVFLFFQMHRLHGLRAVAPLKPLQTKEGHRVELPSPRPQSRGPIEASRRSVSRDPTGGVSTASEPWP